ncbi:beta-alanine-activating enzyme [Musca vetustissima]|uniref:beta-alanine-activating enzyme n=1 Tax=Musca vetustissima TaxID=27455 RepID=UPI002AB60CEC|nr:beta-alanine-activating enzyme [Musca vetustissima]
MNPCYTLKHLKQFSGNLFAQELNYTTIIEEIQQCLNYFQEFEIERAVGIAIDMVEHSVESCILILSILNHGCSFFCNDLKSNNNASAQLKSSGVEYVVSDNVNFFDEMSIKFNGSFKIFDKTYYLGTIKTSSSIKIGGHDDICYTINTSGSTGTPKFVHVPFTCIYPNIKSLCSILEVTERDKILLGSPPTFDPFVVEFFMALETAASLIIVDRSLRINLSEELLQKVTIIQTTPSIFRSFGLHNIRQILNAKTSVRCLLLGGEEFPSMQEMQMWLQVETLRKYSVRIFNIYGITEYSCWATVNEYIHHLHDNGKHTIALGKPLDDVTQLQINNIDNGSILPFGKPGRGELLIGSSVRRCYIPQLDKDINSLENKEIIFRRTGDLVERDIDGNLYYIGRINNCIKRFGKRVCLEHGQQNLQSLLKDNLHDYEQPDKICYISEIPLNKNGKLDRQQLLQDILNVKQTSSETPLTIFQTFLDNVLGIKSLNCNLTKNNETNVKRLKRCLDLSFTAAGGTSFHALNLSLRIGEIMKRSESQRQLLEMLLSSVATIQDILDFLKNNDTAIVSMEKSFAIGNQSSAKNNMLNINLLWRADLKKCVDASPSTNHENVVSVGSHSHLVHTLNTTTGEEISRLQLSDRIECPVVHISQNLAVVGCYDGTLYGFNYRNGKISWIINVNGMIKAKPIVINDLLIIASYAEDYNIHAFKLKTLSSVWQFKLGNKGIFSSPLIVSEDAALFCSLDGFYALVDISSGTPKWIKQLESPIFSSPARLETTNNELILAEVKGKVVVCNRDNGNEISTFRADGNIFSSLTLHRDNKNQHWQIFFGCHDKHLYCLNYDPTKMQLSLLWKFTLNSAIYSTPIVAFNDTIVACSTKGSMVLIDIHTSQLKGSYDIKGEVFSTPCICDNKCIYIGCRDNFLYALEVQ